MQGNQQPEKLTVLGLEITFRPGTDMERAKQAARFVEKRFADQKLRIKGTQGKETLLTFIVLGLADELLQLKNTQVQTENRLANILEKINKSLQD